MTPAQPPRPAAELRIGNARREEASALLADHYAEGRLTMDEYQTRHDTVWRAQTESELWPLFTDLPGAERFAPPATTWATTWPPRRPHPTTPGMVSRGRRITDGWHPLVKVLAALLLLALVLANLHLVVIAGVIWLLLRHKGVVGPR